MDNLSLSQNLVSLINEFFLPSTPNHRKSEIEQTLYNFSKDPSSWKLSLFVITHYNEENYNEFILMYFLGVLETSIKLHWAQHWTSALEKEQIKSVLGQFLFQEFGTHGQNKHKPTLPNSIRNKVIKLLTDVGKFSWPENDPEFLANILHLTASDQTVILGLLFLKTISEEWTNIKDEASTSRKSQLKKYLIKEVPGIFKILQGIISTGYKFRTHNVQAHGESTPVHAPPNFYETISLAFEAILHYMTWIPFESSVGDSQPPMTLEFIDNLCQYSILPVYPPHHSYHHHWDPTQTHHSSLAIESLNEILYRRFVPSQFEKHIRRIVHLGIELLNFILAQHSNKEIPLEYMNKVVDFLSLLTSTHFNQFHSESSKAFLSLLIPFTFRESDPKKYYSYLPIWTKLLDYLSANALIFYDQQNSESDNYAQSLETFKQPILALANGIVQSTVKYRTESCGNDDGEVADTYDEEEEDAQLPKLERNTDILIKIGLLFPNDSMESLMEAWNQSCIFFSQQASAYTSLHGNPQEFQISSPVDVEHFNFIVTLMGRMASFTYGDSRVFKDKTDYGKSVIKQFITIAKVSRPFYTFKRPEAIIDANCNILLALRSWIYFLEKYHSEIVLGESTLDDQMYFFDVLESIVEIVFYGLDKYSEVSHRIVETSVNLFTSLINVIRTQFIYQMGPVQSLISNIHLLKDMNLSIEIIRNLNKSVVILLLLPWQSVSEQEWETRTKQYDAYMKTLLDNFISSESNPASIEFYLNMLMDQLEVITIECGNPKRNCWNALKNIIPYLQKLSVTHLRQPSVEEKILILYTKIMEVLRQQAGIPFFEESIQGFLHLFSTENLINDLLHETESSSLVIEKFLGMLHYMIKDPSPSFKKFIPSTLELCYDHIYPILAQRPTPDLKIPFYNLMRDTIHYRWSWFFGSTMILQQQNASPQPHQDLSALSQQRLSQILQSIGHSFVQSDLEVFRFNLNTLTLWNEKHNFYTRISTLENGKILSQFLTVLLQVLIHKTHDLHREEVSRVLHEMSVAIGTYSFTHDFLTPFLTNHFQILNEDQRAQLRKCFLPGSSSTEIKPDENSLKLTIDFPSFSNTLNVFIDDLRYYCFIMESEKSTTDSSGKM